MPTFSGTSLPPTVRVGDSGDAVIVQTGTSATRPPSMLVLTPTRTTRMLQVASPPPMRQRKRPKREARQHNRH